MSTQKSQIQGLAAVALPNLVGKTIKWSAPSYRGNHPYGGICTITSIDMIARRPITATTLEGDDIQFGFQDETTEGFIDYSDSGRTISFEIVKPKYIIKHSTKGFFQKTSQSEKWIFSPENGFRYATRFYTLGQAEEVAKTLTGSDGQLLKKLEIIVMQAPSQPYGFEVSRAVKTVFN